MCNVCLCVCECVCVLSVCTTLFLHFGFDTAPHWVTLLTLNSRSAISLLAPEVGMFQKILKWISVSPHCERAKPGKWQGGTAAGQVLSRPWGDTEKLCSHSHRLWVEPGVPRLHTSQKFPLQLAFPLLPFPFTSLKLRESPLRSHIPVPGPFVCPP